MRVTFGQFAMYACVFVLVDLAWYGVWDQNWPKGGAKAVSDGILVIGLWFVLKINHLMSDD